MDLLGLVAVRTLFEVRDRYRQVGATVALSGV
jgi:hypothetical protein